MITGLTLDGKYFEIFVDNKKLNADYANIRFNFCPMCGRKL